MAICEIDLRPGGPWRCVWRSADGAEMTLSGVYREVTPFDRVVYTGYRDRSPVSFFDKRDQLVGPLFNLSVKGTF